MFFDLRTLGNGKQLVSSMIRLVALPARRRKPAFERCHPEYRVGAPWEAVKFLNHLSQLSGHSSHTFYTAGASRRVSQWDASTGVMQRES